MEEESFQGPRSKRSDERRQSFEVTEMPLASHVRREQETRSECTVMKQEDTHPTMYFQGLPPLMNDGKERTRATGERIHRP